MTRKPPPFQNLDRMQPKSQRDKKRAGCSGLDTLTNVTAQAPDSISDHVVGSVGCYHAHHPNRSSDDT